MTDDDTLCGSDGPANAPGTIFDRARTAIVETRGSGRLPDGRFGKNNGGALKHGLTSAKVKDAIAVYHRERVAEISESLGGDLSPIEARLVVEMARLEIFSESLGADLMGMSPKATKSAVAGALARYHANIDRHQRLASTLGLRRRPKMGGMAGIVADVTGGTDGN